MLTTQEILLLARGGLICLGLCLCDDGWDSTDGPPMTSHCNNTFLFVPAVASRMRRLRSPFFGDLVVMDHTSIC